MQRLYTTFLDSRDYTLTPAPPPQQLNVVLPEGSDPGSTIQVQTPAGTTIAITIPEGYSAGMTMVVSF
jgi:hypothetical protein